MDMLKRLLLIWTVAILVLWDICPFAA